jgi:choline dehydrogenase-like flavoprotein
MIIDFRELNSSGDIEADICIVGSGAAGVSLARELVRSSHEVCLLESGGLTAETETRDLNRGEVVGRRYQPLEDSRMRFLGGTTNAWLGACTLLNESDFKIRSWVPHSGWPISARDLAPYYRRAQSVCELDAFEFGEEIWRGLGIAVPAFDPEKLKSQFWRYSPPTRFGWTYREELEAAPKLRVLLYATATNVVSNRANSLVEYVDVRSLEGKTARVRARAYVLAMGGIENARLLLNSRGVATAGLGNDHDLVGRFFMEHTYCQCGFLIPGDYEAVLRRFYAMDSGGDRVAPGFRLAEAVQQSEQVLNSAARLDPTEAPLTPGVEAARRIARAVQAGGLPDDLGGDTYDVLRNLDAVLRASYGAVAHGDSHYYDDRGIAVYAQTEQSPNPESRLTLSHERDAMGQNRVALNWQLSELDRRTIAAVARHVAVEFARLGVGRMRISQWLLDQDGGWDESLKWGNHHAGTTRMAHSPRQGVVDANCKLHGLENLYLAGSSVFPTCGYANPTFTLVAMALRLADHLKRELSG